MRKKISSLGAVARRARDEIEAMLAPEEHRSLHAIEANRTAVARALEDADLIAASSVTKKGIDQIRREMISRLEKR